MLAEPAFSIDVQLPQELRDTAHILSGELAWTETDALRVVEWLSAQGSAVVGVELWRDKDGAVLWLATSNYSPRLDDRITSEEVARCSIESARFIRTAGHSPEDLFSLSWLPPVGDETLASLAA